MGRELTARHLSHVVKTSTEEVLKTFSTHDMSFLHVVMKLGPVMSRT